MHPKAGTLSLSGDCKWVLADTWLRTATVTHLEVLKLHSITEPRLRRGIILYTDDCPLSGKGFIYPAPLRGKIAIF